MSYIYIYLEHPFLMFLDHTKRRSTLGRTPLDEWSARRRDLYLTTHDTHNRQISMPPVEFELHDLSKQAAADLRLRPRGQLGPAIVATQLKEIHESLGCAVPRYCVIHHAAFQKMIRRPKMSYSKKKKKWQMQNQINLSVKDGWKGSTLFFNIKTRTEPHIWLVAFKSFESTPPLHPFSTLKRL